VGITEIPFNLFLGVFVHLEKLLSSPLVLPSSATPNSNDAAYQPWILQPHVSLNPSHNPKVALFIKPQHYHPIIFDNKWSTSSEKEIARNFRPGEWNIVSSGYPFPGGQNQSYWYLKPLTCELVKYQTHRAVKYHLQWDISANRTGGEFSEQFKAKMEAAKTFVNALAYRSYANTCTFAINIPTTKEQRAARKADLMEVIMVDHVLNCDLNQPSRPSQFSQPSQSDSGESTTTTEQQIKLAEDAVQGWYDEAKDTKESKDSNSTSFKELFVRHLPLVTLQFAVRYYLEGMFDSELFEEKFFAADKPAGLSYEGDFPTADDHFSNFDPAKLRGKLAELSGNRKLCTYADAVESLRQEVSTLASIGLRVPSPLVNLIGSYLPFLCE
jgi:hypothetical protein